MPLTTLDETPELDLTVDGADEIGPDLTLIKGGGGALLREKIVAAASARMVVIADESKWVETLGRFPLPIEVVPFGLAATRRAVEAAAAAAGCPGPTALRRGKDGHAFVTDGGHWILDAALQRIADPQIAGRPAVCHSGRRRARAFHRARPSRHIAGPAGVASSSGRDRDDQIRKDRPMIARLIARASRAAVAIACACAACAGAQRSQQQPHPRRAVASAKRTGRAQGRRSACSIRSSMA